MNSERGNIIVYALVGLVLFGILLGSLWWVKSQVADAPDAPVATTEEQSKPKTDTEVNQDTTQQGTTSQDAAPADTTPQAPSTSPQQTAPVQTAPATPPASAAPATPPESQTPRTGPSPNNVAASGPVDSTIGTSLALGVIAYFGTSFVRSRRTTH
jgi:cytoskeletal protein RodZ